MKKEYTDENKEFFKTFLNNTFFKNWRESYRKEDPEEDFAILNYSQLEMNIGYACDLKCSYCYYKRSGKELYQNIPVRASDILKNTEKLMNFLYKNKMYANWELFAGEPFVLPYIWDWFDILYEYAAKTDISKRTRAIMIPTNLSFMKNHNKKVLEKIKEYKEKFSSICVDLGLSGSFDGPFMDNFNRKPVNKKHVYNEDFYNRYSSVCEELEIGSHPMIYSSNIEYWIDNFIWFTQNTNHLYLLDVRNWEWTPEQDKHLFYFMKFIVNYIFEYTKEIGISLSDYLQKTQGFNILMSPFSTIGRGLGCSIQSTLDIELHTIELIPCHRMGYKNLATGKFIFEDDGSWDFEPENVEMYIAEQSTDALSLSPCNSCPINTLCSGTCLGANYEASGDPFTVPPSFCRESTAKLAGIVKGFEDIGYIDTILSNVSVIHQSQIEYLLKNFEEM